MIKLFLPALLLACSVNAHAQADTLILKPGPQEGYDALIANSLGCTFSFDSSPKEFINEGANEQFNMIAWTYSAQGCSRATTRSLIRFTALSSLPPGAIIVKATFKLYGLPSTITNNYGNSSFPGSPHGTTNEGWISRITSDWTEYGVTWNTQPTTTPTNRAVVPVSNSQFNWDASIDVTNLVKDILQSDVNYGFMMQLQNEEIRRQHDFASSDNPNPASWPELVVIYNNPTSIAQTGKMASLQISPNPAVDKVQIELPLLSKNDIQLQVTDVTGKIVLKQDYRSEGQSITFSVSDWAKGLYLVQMTGDNWRAASKLSVQ